jgi:hypothetical protein
MDDVSLAATSLTWKVGGAPISGCLEVSANPNWRAQVSGGGPVLAGKPGGGVVHITSVESGCGCTIPSVRPTTVEPDGTAVVSVVGTPLDSGVRTVAITVHTDSPLSSEIILRFKMITDRIPPFITAVAGDFAYPEGYSADDVREFVVTSIESGSQDKIPIVQTDLSFLSVSQPTVRENPFDESSLKQRTYTYRITFNAKSVEGSFVGRIWAVDPWTGIKADGVLASHTAPRPLRVSPSRVTLSVRADGEIGRAEIVVLTKRPMAELVVEPANGGSGAIEVLEIKSDTTTRLRRFLIRAKRAGVTGMKDVAVLIKENADARESVLIPVVFRSVSP